MSFSSSVLRLFGWRVINDIPPDLKKFIIAVAPHTSWKDVVLGLFVRPSLKRKAYYLGKKESSRHAPRARGTECAYYCADLH